MGVVDVAVTRGEPDVSLSGKEGQALLEAFVGFPAISDQPPDKAGREIAITLKDQKNLNVTRLDLNILRHT